jgi:hypothetical protein
MFCVLIVILAFVVSFLDSKDCKQEFIKYNIDVVIFTYIPNNLELG